MSDVTFGFVDRMVVITGASSGIGRAAAQAFSAAGAAVYLLDIDEEHGVEAATDTGTFVRCDVTSESDVIEAIEHIRIDAERIDILVNVAGGFWNQRTSAETPTDEWRDIVDLNLTSVFLLSRAAVPLLRRSDAGRIINISSLAARLTSYKTSPPYAAAKAGLEGLTRVMASELAADGITVNALAPSAVLTDRIREVRSEQERAATAATIPLGRYQAPEELASWVLFLASKEAGFATGQTIGVNGGRFMS